MANTFKFGNKNWAWKEDYVLAYNDENNNFKPLPFDFTRSSSATRVNSSGLIETVGSGEPRVDYLNNADGHLLLEPSRTNSILYSNGFDDSTWQKGLGGTASAPVVTANQGTSPDGSNNAYKVDFDLGGGTTSTDRSRLTQSVTGTSSTEYVFTFYAKAYSTSDVGKIVNFSVDNVSDEDANFTLTSEWQRFTFSGTSTGTNINQHIQLRGNLSTSDSASMLLFGYQMEVGSYATSYIPTSGSSVTRAAESASQDTPTDAIGQTEGTLFLDVTPSNFDGDQRIAISDGTSANRIALRLSGSSIQLSVVIGSTTQASISGSGSAGNSYKIAGAYKANDFVIYINGVQAAVDTSGSISGTFDRIGFDRGDGNNDFYNPIKDFRLYDTRLSNAELAQLTS